MNHPIWGVPNFDYRSLGLPVFVATGNPRWFQTPFGKHGWEIPIWCIWDVIEVWLDFPRRCSDFLIFISKSHWSIPGDSHGFFRITVDDGDTQVRALPLKHLPCLGMLP
jgi:hypothetical protein